MKAIHMNDLIYDTDKWNMSFYVRGENDIITRLWRISQDIQIELLNIHDTIRGISWVFNREADNERIRV